MTGPTRVNALEGRLPCQIEGLASVANAYVPAAGAPPLFIDHVEGALACTAEFLEWTRQNRALLDDLILQYGGVVLRGFPMATAEDFDAFVSNFPAYEHGYVSGMSPRRKVAGKVLESTRLAQEYKITLHSEMAYMKTYPPRIAFFCRRAAQVGGETIIGSLRELTRRIPSALREKLERHKVHVVRNFAPCGASRDAVTVGHSDMVGWDDAFFTDDRSEVEAQCHKLGIQPIWNEDGSLTLLDVIEPFTTHPRTGERFYRSNIHANRAADRQGFGHLRIKAQAGQKMRTGQYLDNGEELTPEESETIFSLLEQIEIAWPWQNGDLMILDNLQVAHGRNPFSGPREVLVALLG